MSAGFNNELVRLEKQFECMLNWRKLKENSASYASKPKDFVAAKL